MLQSNFKLLKNFENVSQFEKILLNQIKISKISKKNIIVYLVKFWIKFCQKNSQPTLILFLTLCYLKNYENSQKIGIFIAGGP